MIAVDNQVAVLPVSVSTIFSAPNAADLFRANAEECLVPNASPQRTQYEAMEQAGVLRCFGAYADDRLVGFCSVLVALQMPHTGRPQATGESIFVNPAYRGTGAGNLLIEAAEEYADSIHAVLAWLPRTGSQLDKLLSCRSGYSLTHSQHTRRLA